MRFWFYEKFLNKFDKNYEKIKIEYCSEKLKLAKKPHLIGIGIIKCAAYLYPFA